jgi:hypothetical protein
MRKLAITVTLLVVLGTAYAQDKANYWVVETSGKTATETIVKIYDANHNVIRETRVDRLIDIKKRKERKKLNRMVKDVNPVLWSKR